MTDGNPGADWSDATRVFDEHRDLLFAVVYRVLGSVADADDVMQEAWLRWVNARPSEVADPRAFLVRVSTRLAVDRLRRVKTRRESYVGPWLPEPVRHSTPTLAMSRAGGGGASLGQKAPRTRPSATITGAHG